MDLEVYVYYYKNHEIVCGTYHSEIRAYGITEDGKNCCLRFECVTTRIFLEFPEKYLEENWSSIKNSLINIIFNKDDKATVKIVEKEKLYYFNRNKSGERKTYKFVVIEFQSRIGMYSFRKRLPDCQFEFLPKIHELKANTELQFIVKNKLSPSGWVKIKNWEPLSVEDNCRETHCEYEISLSEYDIEALDANTLNPDIKIASWDIEAKCKNIAKSPGSDINDCVFQISFVVYNYVSTNLKKYLLTLGSCKDIADDIIVLTYKCEKDLILGFTELINTERPHLLTGWNIFNFDIKFLIKRAEIHQCLGEFLCFGFSNDQSTVQKLKWSSKAMLTTDIEYIETEGMMFIDLIEIVRKDYKLDSYSLQNVSKHFLDEQKDDISFKELMHAYNCYIKNLPEAEYELSRTGKYCVQDSVLVLQLFNKIQAWLGLSEMAKTTCTQILNVHLNGQQKKYYNQIYKYCYSNNIVVEEDVYESPDTDRYSGAYVFEPKTGLHEYVVSLDFNSLYPSIIIAYNIDYTTLVRDPENYDPDDLNIMEWEDHLGCEHDKLVIQKEIYTEKINSCLLSKQQKQFQKERAALTKKISKKIICQKNSFSFVKKHIREGVVPKIIQELLRARKDVRLEMTTITDKEIKQVYNQKQLSYKISANSMYGSMGVRTGALPFMPLAMCVTYTGRESIKRAALILGEELGGEIIYGDTDSNYVIFKDLKSKNHFEMCNEIWDRAISAAKYISSKFPDPMNIEFEDAIYYKYFILSKKMYMYISCNKEGEISPKLHKKGVLLSRRDNSLFVKNVYEQTVKNILDRKPIEFNIQDLFKSVYDLHTFEILDEKLVITKSVNDYDECNVIFNEQTQKYYMGSYIVKDCTKDISRLPAQVQLEINTINAGEEKSEGSRIEYVVVDRPGFTKQFHKLEKYGTLKLNKSLCKPDYQYYATRLINPITQLFECAFGNKDVVMKTINVFLQKKKNIEELKSLFRSKIVIVK